MRWRMVSPTRWLDRLAERHTARVLRYERSLVEDGPEAERGLFWRDMARTAVYMVAVVAVSWLPDDVLWRTLACAVLGGMVGGQAIKLMQRAGAYRSGWLAGRLRFIEQAGQHQERGNSPSVWMQTEVEHDLVNVMGGLTVDVVAVHGDDGDEDDDDERRKP